VGFAVTSRSLFSLLSGARQPSRALALLIERTLGYRADFLLSGKGDMWTSPSRGAAASLSPLEHEVIAFMRRSVDNARAMERALEDARLWERLFARTRTMLAELEACAADPEQRLLYPAFAKLVYEDSRFVAARFEQLMALIHRRRVHRLTTAYLARYVGDLPRAMVKRRELAELEAMLDPVTRRRAERLRALDESIDALRTTLENFCSLGSPLPMLAARSPLRRAQRRRASIAKLDAAIADAALPRRAAADISAAMAALKAADADLPTIWSQMKQMTRDLLHELEAEIAFVPAQSLEELRAMHEQFVAPLMA
jgi:hypothetical protein